MRDSRWHVKSLTLRWGSLAGRSMTRPWLALVMILLIWRGMEGRALGQSAAQERPKSPELEEAERLDKQAKEYYARGEYDQALALVERSLEIRDRNLGSSHPEVAVSLNNLAMLQQEQGRYDKALPLYQRSLAVMEKALGQDHLLVAACLSNLASLHMERGEYEAAVSLAQRALAIQEKTLGNDHLEVALTLNNLAMMYKRTGEYDKALSLSQRALAIREKALGNVHVEVATALNNLATLHRDRGEYEKALSLHQRSLIIMEKTLGNSHPSVAIPLNNLALLLQEQGEYDEALRLYERSLSIAEKALGQDHHEVAKTLNNLAILHMHTREYGKALPLLQRALLLREKALGKNHHDVAASLNNLAMLHQYKGEYDKALPLVQQAVVIWENALGDVHPDVASSRHNLAIAHWAGGEIAEAMTFFERSQDAREAHFSLVMAGDSEQAKRLFLTKYYHELDTVISFAIQTEQSEARRLASTTLLRRKGRVLDSTSDMFAAVRASAKPDVLALLDQYRANRTQYATQLLRGPERIPPEQHQTNLQALQHRAEELEQTLSAHSREFRIQNTPVTVEAVKAALPAGAALIEWVRYRPFNVRATNKADQYGPARYAASILHSTGEPVWLDLGLVEPIDTLVAAWRDALDRNLDTTNDAARKLDALVMQPVRAHLADARQVILAPDSALNLVPFAALVDERGKYLIERYSFTYVTSGRDLIRLRTHADVPARSPAMIIADPSYDVPGRPSSRRFSRIAGAAAEARAISALFPRATSLTSDMATEAALKQTHGPAIVHIATHGYFQPVHCAEGEWESSKSAEDPQLQSGLALAGANACQSPDHGQQDTGDDGLLTAVEVASLDLYGTKLAVLSACETGIGSTELQDSCGQAIGRGEGVYGLRRALVLAGAETQMLSLWSIDDAMTQKLVTAYYQKLAQGVGRSEALRQVQLALLKSQEWSYPHYWASFIVSGSDAPLTGSDAPLTDTAAQPKLPAARGPRGCACELAAGSHGSDKSLSWLLLLVAAIIVAGRIRRRHA